MYKWLLYLIPSFLFSLLGYLLNPLVLLFCDEDGELPMVLKGFQTWDNSCNPSDLLNALPAWLIDWYPGHYIETYGDSPELEGTGRKRWKTTCIDPYFTKMQKLKRYISRVYWLYRNNSYGFAFWLLGGIYEPAHPFYTHQSEHTSFQMDLKNQEFWTYTNSAPIIWKLHFNMYLGWKFPPQNTFESTRCMIANRLWFRWE